MMTAKVEAGHLDGSRLGGASEYPLFAPCGIRRVIFYSRQFDWRPGMDIVRLMRQVRQTGAVTEVPRDIGPLTKRWPWITCDGSKWGSQRAVMFFIRFSSN